MQTLTIPCVRAHSVLSTEMHECLIFSCRFFLPSEHQVHRGTGLQFAAPGYASRGAATVATQAKLYQKCSESGPET